MRLSIRIVAIAAAAAVLLALVASAEARTWRRISAPNQSNTSQVSLLRNTNGSLTALGLFKGAAPGGSDIVKVPITASGGVGASTVLASGAAYTILENPQAILQGGVPTAVFAAMSSSGQDGLWTMNIDTAAPAFYSGAGGGPTAAASGTSAGATASGGFAAWASTFGLGTLALGNPAATPQSLPLTGCCAYNQAFAIPSGGAVWVAYDSNEDAATGRWFQRIDPITGAAAGTRVKVPSTFVHGGFDFPVQSRVPVATAGNLVYTAWAQGYPTTNRVGLWRVGTATAKRFDVGMDVGAVGIATTPDKRIWLFWADRSTGSIYAMRSNTARTLWTVPQRVGKPSRSIETVYKIVGNADRADGKLDIAAAMATYVGDPTWYVTQVAP